MKAGFMHLPLALALALTLTAGLGLHSILRLWSHQVETQYRLDRCTALLAQRLKQHLLQLERGNQAITAARLALAASVMTPALASPARAALEGLVLHQESLRGAWKLDQTTWSLRRGCDAQWLDRARTLPDLPYVRDPPDPLGPLPLRWIGQDATPLIVQLSHGNRIAVALIEGQEEGNQNAPTRWKLRWTSLP